MKPAPAKTRAVSAKTQEMMEAMAPVASEDQLSRIRTQVAEFRDLLEINADLESRIEANKVRIKELRDKELVELFDSARISRLALEPVGNHAAFEVEIGPYYHANIAADWEPERRARAFAWFDKYHPDLPGMTFTVKMGRGTAKKQKALMAFLRKSKIEFSNEYGIPWNTLTAFVREQIETYKKTPPLEMLGATVGRVAIIKKPKKEK